MTSHIFQQWILAWNQRLAQQGRSVLLLIDNFVGHVLPSSSLSHIRAEMIHSSVHPLNQGIIQSFKLDYRRRFMSRALRRFDQVSAAEIYSIDPLTAMRLCRAAWHAVPIQNIKTCWSQTRILNLRPSEFLYVPHFSFILRICCL